MRDFLLYLSEAALCLAAFALLYRLSLHRLTTFQANRIYLLSAVVLSLSIPLMPWPMRGSDAVMLPSRDVFLPLVNALPIQELPEVGEAKAVLSTDVTATPHTASPVDWGRIALFTVLGLYLLGAVAKLVALGRNLGHLYRLLRRNLVVREGAYRMVYLTQEGPAFSFLRWIVLSRTQQQLPEAERAQVIRHEAVHLAQGHTWDLLFFELAGVAFWFHPALYYLKRELRSVHEYIADAEVGRRDPRTYSHLLLKLAQASRAHASTPLVTSFAALPLKKRIRKLTQAPSSIWQQSKFALALPLVGGLLWGCALTNEVIPVATLTSSSVEPRARIGTITWTGNTWYDDATLTQVLGVQEGDPYDKAEIQKRLWFNPGGQDVASFYKKGEYVFFRVEEEVTERENHTVDLTFHLEEDQPLKIRDIGYGFSRTDSEVSSGVSVDALTDVLLEVENKIPTQMGDWFDRTKLMETQHIMEALELFDPERVEIVLKPVQAVEEGDEGNYVSVDISMAPKGLPWVTVRYNGEVVKMNEALLLDAVGTLSVEVNDPTGVLPDGEPIKAAIMLIHDRQKVEELRFDDYREVENYDLSGLWKKAQPGDRLFVGVNEVDFFFAELH
ncbi:Signal transducer regulating beta-lactamase production, contains metallopeptidase domain [Catalinimonas alkaloidigena]|uniref:Signal transducer regulating beta-lactamase production, contains metallopeptidase domain n=1 Tax=Catalinimonas alkaloidigena TaxID=1075417 RepID=A0A1G8ZZ85_9BACT|nr:M56 family metallopeptidase [Catalinimonas alkaloidigena]SDK20439.1 Signal transducer regulating beta-lactamase production, contains metallopeptidase domain [Catalinimonas alkaloidigena]